MRNNTQDLRGCCSASTIAKSQTALNSINKRTMKSFIVFFFFELLQINSSKKSDGLSKFSWPFIHKFRTNENNVMN